MNPATEILQAITKHATCELFVSLDGSDEQPTAYLECLTCRETVLSYDADPALLPDDECLTCGHRFWACTCPVMRHA